jgi:uncharacterized membrane protein
MISATHFHAMVIHFPIALIMAGFLSEIISLFSKKEFFRHASIYLLLLGALGASVAYISGSYAGEGIEEGPLKIPMELHEQAAGITLWLAIIAALFNVILYFLKYDRRWTKWVFIILITALAGSVTTTGYLGGQLVYKHAAGVQFDIPVFNADAEED